MGLRSRRKKNDALVSAFGPGGYGAWTGASPMQYSPLLAQAYVAHAQLMQQYNPYATHPPALHKQEQKKSKKEKKEKKERKKSKHGYGYGCGRSKKGETKKAKGVDSESLNSSSSSFQRKHGTGNGLSKKSKKDNAEMQGPPRPSEAADQRARLQALLSGLEVDEEDDSEELTQKGVWADPPPEVPRPSSTNAGAHRRDLSGGSPESGAQQEEPERAARPSLAPQLIQALTNEAAQQLDNGASLVPQSEKERMLYEWLRSLDIGNSSLLRYFRVLKEEFASDFERIKFAQVRNTSSSGLLSTIDPTFWEVCGVKSLSHRVLLAKGINALSSRTHKSS